MESTPSTKGPDLGRLKIDKGRSPQPRKGGRAIVALLVVAVVGALLWVERDRLISRWAPDPGPQLLPLVSVEAAGPLRDASEGLAANGHVVARRRAELSTVLSGRLVEMGVEEGTRVTEGQVVARIQSDDFEARVGEAEKALALIEARQREAQAEVATAGVEVAEARARAEAVATRRTAAEAEAWEALRERERQEKNHADGIISDSDWDRVVARARQLEAMREAARADQVSAERAIETALARQKSREVAVRTFDADIGRQRSVLEAAKIDLEKTLVRAPFAGVIVRKGAEQGEVISAVAAGTNSKGAVATLVDLDTLEVQVELTEIRLGKLQEGDQALIFLDIEGRRAWPGHIRQIWPRADRSKGTVEIRIVFDERPPLLREEMGLRVVFRGAPAAQPAVEAELALVESAILAETGGTSVLLVDGGRIRRVPVEILDRREGKAFLRADLRPGDRVLAAPRASIADGTSYESLAER